jgi:fructokinase
MKQSSIVVFGEALVDVFKSASVVGGAPFNVARHLAGFGLNPLFLSAIGNDTNGALVQQQISHFQLDPQGVQILVNQRTGIVQVHENALGHQFEIMPNCAYDFIETDAALTRINTKNNTNLSTLSMLYHGTLGLRGEVSLQAFKAVSGQASKAKNANIFLDINWRAGHVDQAVAMQCLQDANIIKLSIEELQMVLPWFNIFTDCDSKLPSINNILQPVKQLMTHFKAHLLLVTYGDLGSAAFNKDGVCEAAALGLKNKEIIDTVGAGDAFSSVMILAITQGWAMDLALQRANEFAAGICGIRGATPTDLTFYKQYLAAWNH